MNVEYNNMQQILKQTDYIALKLAEGADPLQYAEVLTLRQRCRGKLSEWDDNTQDFKTSTFDDIKAKKRREIVAARYNAEIAGITFNGITIKTDRETRFAMVEAYLQTYFNPDYTLNWKTGDNTFILLSADQIMTIETVIRQHVQSCFDHEAELISLIEMSTNEIELDNIKWNL